MNKKFILKIPMLLGTLNGFGFLINIFIIFNLVYLLLTSTQYHSSPSLTVQLDQPFDWAKLKEKFIPL